MPAQVGAESANATAAVMSVTATLRHGNQSNEWRMAISDWRLAFVEERRRADHWLIGAKMQAVSCNRNGCFARTGESAGFVVSNGHRGIAHASDRPATLHGVVFDILGPRAAVGHAAGLPGRSARPRCEHSSSPALCAIARRSGRSSIPETSMIIERPRRTGCPACAWHDDCWPSNAELSTHVAGPPQLACSSRTSVRSRIALSASIGSPKK